MKRIEIEFVPEPEERHGYEEGMCPNCESRDITYGNMFPDGNSIYYEMTCNDCGFTGREYYNTEFVEIVEIK